jgi:hypothetical protein
MIVQEGLFAAMELGKVLNSVMTEILKTMTAALGSV